MDDSPNVGSNDSSGPPPLVPAEMYSHGCWWRAVVAAADATTKPLDDESSNDSSGPPPLVPIEMYSNGCWWRAVVSVADAKTDDDDESLSVVAAADANTNDNESLADSSGPPPLVPAAMYWHGVLWWTDVTTNDDKPLADSSGPPPLVPTEMYCNGVLWRAVVAAADAKTDDAHTCEARTNDDDESMSTVAAADANTNDNKSLDDSSVPPPLVPADMYWHRVWWRAVVAAADDKPLDDESLTKRMYWNGFWWRAVVFAADAKTTDDDESQSVVAAADANTNDNGSLDDSSGPPPLVPAEMYCNGILWRADGSVAAAKTDDNELLSVVAAADANTNDNGSSSDDSSSDDSSSDESSSSSSSDDNPDPAGSTQTTATKVTAAAAAAFTLDDRAHFGIHEVMLKDLTTSTYRDAIVNNRHLFAGKVVLNVDCGTGVLAMYAALAGAAHVYGIENSKIVHTARQIVAANRLSNAITIIGGTVEAIELPVPKVDIIIADWMGNCLFHNCTLETVIRARDKWLQPDGLLFPDHGSLYITAIEDLPNKTAKIDMWTDVYGFDMGDIRAVALTEPIVDVIRPSQIASSASKIHELDLYTVTADDLQFDSAFQLVMVRDEAVHALCMWFRVEFSKCAGQLCIDTSPLVAYTRWGQTIFYLDDCVAAKKDEAINGRVQMLRNGKTLSDLRFNIRVNFVGELMEFTETNTYRMH